MLRNTNVYSIVPSFFLSFSFLTQIEKSIARRNQNTFFNSFVDAAVPLWLKVSNLIITAKGFGRFV